MTYTPALEDSLDALAATALQVKRERDDFLTALYEIAAGKGAFSTDRLTHATNTIESMKDIARAAIRRAKGMP